MKNSIQEPVLGCQVYLSMWCYDSFQILSGQSMHMLPTSLFIQIYSCFEDCEFVMILAVAIPFIPISLFLICKLLSLPARNLTLIILQVVAYLLNPRAHIKYFWKFQPTFQLHYLCRALSVFGLRVIALVNPHFSAITSLSLSLSLSHTHPFNALAVFTQDTDRFILFLFVRFSLFLFASVMGLLLE